MIKKKYENCQNCGKKIDSGKFCSDICEKVYNRSPEGAKPLQAIEEQNKVQKYCKNCGKPIRHDLDFCSAKCIREFKFKERNPDKTVKNAFEEQVIRSENKNQVEESATEYMRRRKAEKKKKTEKKTEQKQVKNNKFGDNPDFQILLSGDGMNRRDHNIDVIKNYVIAGFSFNEIWKRVRRKLTSRRLEEYYNIVLDEIKNEV